MKGGLRDFKEKGQTRAFFQDSEGEKKINTQITQKSWHIYAFTSYIHDLDFNMKIFFV